MIVGAVWKAPAEVITRSIDFSASLTTGETLSTIQSVTAIDPQGNDDAATIVGPTSPFIQSGGLIVQLQLQAGTLNDSYSVIVTCATSASNVVQAELLLFIGLPIDLTTVALVKKWVAIPPGATQDDQVIQDIITGFSAYVLRATGRAAQDGSIPAQSPFVAPVAYAEIYDGSGTNRQPIRNWPITSVSSLNIDGQVIPQSTSINVFGWVIDGDGRFVSLRGGYSANVATFQNYRFQGQRGSGVSFGFSAGTQNVEISYTAGFNGVPFDLEIAARKVCALNYKRRGWIGQKMQQLAAGAGMVQYTDWEMEPQDAKTIMYYQRRVA